MVRLLREGFWGRFIGRSERFPPNNQLNVPESGQMQGQEISSVQLRQSWPLLDKLLGATVCMNGRLESFMHVPVIPTLGSKAVPPSYQAYADQPRCLCGSGLACAADI